MCYVLPTIHKQSLCLWGGGNPLHPLLTNKGGKMNKYFVIGFRKIRTEEEYKNKIAGHNHRQRHYKNRVNINWEKTKDNIILQNLKYKTAEELITNGNSNLKGKARRLKKGSSFCFEIVVDCTPDPSWTEQDYVRYLKDAKEFFDKRFEGQECVSAVIHMDESKPHLHLTYSYFNSDLGKWNQRNLMQEKKTDLNRILKDFQKEVGQKYGLTKGDGKNLDKKLLKEFVKAQVKVPVKTGILKTEERKFLSIKKAKQAIKNLDKKYKISVSENDKLKEELIKTKRENGKMKEKIDEMERENIMLSKKLTNIDKLERENKELKEKLMSTKNTIDKLAEELAETKAKLSKAPGKAKQIIKEQISKKIHSI
jgi:hypothetical protein